MPKVLILIEKIKKIDRASNEYGRGEIFGWADVSGEKVCYSSEKILYLS